MQDAGPPPRAPVLRPPPPAYPAQVKEELEESCYFTPRRPAYTIPEESQSFGHPMFGLQPGPGSSTSPMRDFWSPPGPYAPAGPSPWGPQPPSYSCSSSYSLHPGTAAEQLSYVPCSSSSTPDTPDSGYWDTGLEGSPPQYSQLEESWTGPSVEHAPLPELSLQEILGELDEDWLGGEGPDKLAFC